MNFQVLSFGLGSKVYDHETLSIRSCKVYDLAKVYDLDWKYTISKGKYTIICEKYKVICWKYTIFLVNDP